MTRVLLSGEKNWHLVRSFRLGLWGHCVSPDRASEMNLLIFFLNKSYPYEQLTFRTLQSYEAESKTLQSKASKVSYLLVYFLLPSSVSSGKLLTSLGLSVHT